MKKDFFHNIGIAIGNAIKEVSKAFKEIESEKERKVAQGMVFLIGLIAIGLAVYFLVCAMPYIAGLVALGVLFLLIDRIDHLVNGSNMIQFTGIDINSVWELTFEVLRDNASALDLIPPAEARDILCTEHLTPILINNCKVLRFINMESYCDPVKDCDYVKGALNTLLNQRLSNGYPNLPIVNGIYPIQVIDVGHSSQHRGFVYIDVLLIDSLDALNMCNQKNGNHPQSPPSSPKDKDFN